MRELQCVPHLIVCVALSRIQIEPDRTGEENRILWDDSEALSHVMQTDAADVDVINDDAPAGSFDQAEQTEGHRAFTRASATHDANLRK